jgi:hypothetical protein
MIWPLWLITKCSLRPKNHPHLAIPTATPLEPSASFAHGGLAAGSQFVEDLVAVDAAVVADGELARVAEVDAALLAAEAVQQHHQRGKQPRHQADEAIIMRQIAKAGAMLNADPVEVEGLEILVRREVKQHHDEQHLGA